MNWGVQAPKPMVYGLSGAGPTRNGVIYKGGGNSRFLPKVHISDSSNLLLRPSPLLWIPWPGSGKPESSQTKEAKSRAAWMRRGAVGEGSRVDRTKGLFKESPEV